MAHSVERLPFHEFFAGSGLVSCGLSGEFCSVWANDVSARKAAVYRANFGADAFHLGDVAQVLGSELPRACLSWASFPCQDLSLAGNIDGIYSARSGLVWQWMRIMDEMGGDAPRVLCLENVSGLVSAHGGEDYAHLHAALVERGYAVGPPRSSPTPPRGRTRSRSYAAPPGSRGSSGGTSPSRRKGSPSWVT